MPQFEHWKQTNMDAVDACENPKKQELIRHEMEEVKKVIWEAKNNGVVPNVGETKGNVLGVKKKK